MGEVFVGWEGVGFGAGCGFAPVLWVAFVWNNALDESRDSACRRPFGVRLRGDGWFQHSPLHVCAAPLRMTRRVWRFVGYNPLVAMLL